MDYRIVHREATKAHVTAMKKVGRTDLEIAWFLAGMKFGFFTAMNVSARDSMALVEVALEFQKQFDPDGVTWAKPGKED